MTNRLELNWNLDGFVDEQRYYCSERPLDINNLPAPKVVLSGDVRSHTDFAVIQDKTYYIRIGSVKNNTEKLSAEIIATTSTFIKKMYFIGIEDTNIASREAVFRGIANSLGIELISLTFQEVLSLTVADGILAFPSLIGTLPFNGFVDKVFELQGNGAPVITFSYGTNGNTAPYNVLGKLGFASNFGDMADITSSFDFIQNDILEPPFNQNSTIQLRATSYYASTVIGLCANASIFCMYSNKVAGAILKPGAENINGAVNASPIIFCSAVYFSPAQNRNLNASGIELLTQLISKTANRAWS